MMTEGEFLEHCQQQHSNDSIDLLAFSRSHNDDGYSCYFVHGSSPALVVLGKSSSRDVGVAVISLKTGDYSCVVTGDKFQLVMPAMQLSQFKSEIRHILRRNNSYRCFEVLSWGCYMAARYCGYDLNVEVKEIV